MLFKRAILIAFVFGCAHSIDNAVIDVSSINNPHATDANIKVEADVTFTSSNKTCTTNSTEFGASSNPHYNRIPFPKMPDKIRAILQSDYNILDPLGSEMISTFSQYEGTVTFAHARSTFLEHLRGTFSILSAWNQPTAVKRAGLIHTGYSGDLFQFFLFDSNSEDERQKLRDIIGEEAEALVYLFGTVNRGTMCQFKDTVDRIVPGANCPNSSQPIAHRGLGSITVTPEQTADILMVTIADYLDQMVDTNGWRDHHQVDDGGHHLYPGNGRPALGFYWFSSVCHAIREYLDVIPTVFNHCQDVISVEDEEIARNAYWKVTTEEQNLETREQIELLQVTVDLNPFVGEPHLLLAQIHFREKNYLDAAIESRRALEKFYTLASCWDKRRSFEYWVGYARIMLMRANRALEDEPCSFPCVDAEDPLYVNHYNLRLTNLNHLVKDMRGREEESF